MRLTIALTAWAFAVACVAAHADDDPKRVAREREQLRRTQQSLREAQEQLGSAQSERDRLAAERKQADAELVKSRAAAAAAEARARSLRVELERTRASLVQTQTELRGERSAHQADNEAGAKREDALQAQWQTTRGELAESRQTNAALSAALGRGVEALDKAEAANRKLVGISTGLLDAWRHKGLGDVLKQREPVFGLKDVEVENQAEALRASIRANRLMADVLPPPATDGAAPR